METQGTPELCRKMKLDGTLCGMILDREGSPKWCKKCWAIYQKEYQENHKETLRKMTESRGYAAGISAFREHIVKKFEAIGTTATFNGAVAAKWVRGEQITMPQD